MTEPVILMQAELEAALAHWQGILRLRDWDIVIAIKRRKQWAGSSEGVANSDWHLASRHATIHILDAADYAADTFEQPQDMEEDLVHELLHGLYHEELISIEASGLRRNMFEAAINATASALVRLSRLDPRIPTATTVTVGEMVADVSKVQVQVRSDGISPRD